MAGKNPWIICSQDQRGGGGGGGGQRVKCCGKIKAYNTPFTTRSQVHPGILNVGQSRVGPGFRPLLYQNKYSESIHTPGPTRVQS